MSRDHNEIAPVRSLSELTDAELECVSGGVLVLTGGGPGEPPGCLSGAPDAFTWTPKSSPFPTTK